VQHLAGDIALTAEESFFLPMVRAMNAANTLFREPPNAEGDRQSDDDHVPAALKHIVKLVWALRVKRGERQDDVPHHQLNGSAKVQATYQRMLFQECQPAACCV